MLGRHVFGMKVYFETHVDGKRVGRKRLSRSFVQGFARGVMVMMSSVSQGAQNDITGTPITISANAGLFDTRAANDAQNPGIQVGTGTTAVATSDTKLVTRITTGSGAGQLRYLIQQFNNLSVNTTDCTFQLIRSFVNNSGGSITVNEIAVYCNVDATPHVFCMIRDIIGGGVAVAAGKTLTVTYTFSFPV